MTIKKKLFSVLLSLVMMLQVCAFTLPVYADDIAELETNTEADNLEYKLQAIRQETNLFPNGDVELGELGGNVDLGNENAKVWGMWGTYKSGGNGPTVTHTTKQAYNGEKSLLIEKTDNYWALYVPYVFGDALREDTTYIANMKILGTKKNANEGWATVSNPNTQWENKVNIFPYFGEFTWSGYTTIGTYSLKDLSDAPYAAEENQEKLPQSAWKNLGATFVTPESRNSLNLSAASISSLNRGMPRGYAHKERCRCAFPYSRLKEFCLCHSPSYRQHPRAYLP